MASFNYLLAAIFVASSFISCVAAKQEDVLVVVVPQTNATSTERTAAGASARTGRIMQVFKTDHSRAGSAIRHVHPQPGGMRARADRFPAPPGGMQQRHHIVYQRRPINAVRPQILRRVQSNLPLRREHPRYEVVKSSRYSNVKSGPHHAPGVQSGAYPNALTQQGSAQSSYGHHFKASPNFNGNVEVRPAGAAQYPPQREQQRYSPYVDARGQQQQQSLNQREQFTLSSFEAQPPPHEQKFASQQQQQQQQQFSYYQQPKPQPEPLLRPKPKIQRVKFEYPPERYAPSSPGFNKATAPSGYAVYEDPDQLQAAEDYAAQTNGAEGERREAQEYLKFMSSNVYFLPKRDPNYRDIDVERDHLQYEPHQQQQQQQQQQQKQNYHLQQQQQVEQEQLYSMTPLYDSSSAPNQRQYSNHHNQHASPKSGSPPFFEEASAASSSSGAIVRGSYQAGQNEFIVSSDGKKGIKHIVPAPLMPSSTSRTPVSAAAAASSSAAMTYQHFHLGGAARHRTPEPVRFEFTERDAISPATYTHSPLITGQLRKSSQGVAAAAVNNGNYVPRSTPRIPTSIPATTRQETASNYDDVAKPIHENLDDPEDDDDMLETDANTYGRVAPHSTKTGSSQELPIEQKDTEDYCERICSNVQDDDEEIVCGSDGYMYTSEAQMECYASCLHIDVTIQSKGACSKR